MISRLERPRNDRLSLLIHKSCACGGLYRGGKMDKSGALKSYLGAESWREQPRLCRLLHRWSCQQYQAFRGPISFELLVGSRDHWDPRSSEKRRADAESWSQRGQKISMAAVFRGNINMCVWRNIKASTYGICNTKQRCGSSTPQEVIFGSEPNKTFSPIDDSYQLSTPFDVKAVPRKILKRRPETYPKLQTGPLITTLGKMTRSLIGQKHKTWQQTSDRFLIWSVGVPG